MLVNAARPTVFGLDALTHREAQISLTAPLTGLARAVPSSLTACRKGARYFPETIAIAECSTSWLTYRNIATSFADRRGFLDCDNE